MKLTTIIAALGVAGAAAQVLPDHTILTNVNIVAMARMDPIANPGEVASHMHTILGASNFRCKSI